MLLPHISDHCKILTQIDNINQTYLAKPEERETYNWLNLPNKYKQINISGKKNTQKI